ncbi:hypothetical protein COHA_010413 [Chlorella ohadii]|uniref:Pyrroloquinoline quinone-dependent pyranose dehydrogenase beta-propeller domain-containing protein n=1 Tax=Chlorella ohadii TaxID=2649997 RepID=A0AAD5DGE1_9CHLO|nr:hypothetical protein COHA_010413 [Chlorella ohadii]
MGDQRRLSSRAALVMLGCLALSISPAAAAFNRSDWTLPEGFNIEPYVAGSEPVPLARSLALSGASQPNGPVITYVSSNSFDASQLMNISVMVDLKGRGQADYVQPLLVNLSAMPNGIAWHNGSLWVASLEPYKSCRIYRLDNADRYALERQAAKLSDLVLVRGDLPFDIYHGWKFIRFGPDGKLYFPIGANCNVCRLDGSPPNNGTLNGKLAYSMEASENATHVTAPFQAGPGSPVFQFGSIYRMDTDGSGVELVATGIRNTVGFDFHPDTGQLVFTDNGRDDWSAANPAATDNRPDCELNIVTAPRQFFGWPYCATGPAGGDPNARPYLRRPGATSVPDPDLNAGEKVMNCTGANLQFTPAIQALGPHVSPLGMRFYRWSPGASFPKQFNRDIFIAEHGSWNRQRPIGARVMRVVLDPANPTKVQAHLPFLCGGVPGDTCAPTGPVPPVQPGAEYKGRPVDVEQLLDGSLLVSDDAAGTVYRIAYSQPTKCRKLGEWSADGHVALAPAAIPGTASGCAVNLGAGNVPGYRRCMRADVSQGAGRQMQLATSLRVLNNQLVLSGALLLPSYGCTLGRSGWVGFGLPESQAGTRQMFGARVFVAQPAPKAPTGASVAAYLLNGTSPYQFYKPPGLLPRGGTLKAYISGGALATAFDFILPTEFQKAAARAGKIAPAPGQDSGGADPSSISFLMAFGDVIEGELKFHWMTASLTIPFSVADIGVPLPSNLPVLNRGAGPSAQELPTAPSPKRALPPQPSPPPLPPAACAPGAKCCLNGVNYTSCQSDSLAGFFYTQLYRVANGTLHVGIRASTDGWIAWSLNQASPGRMVGGDALVVRPCTTCRTGVSTAAFNLGGYSTSAFSAPRSTAFTVAAAGTAEGGSAIWAQFSLPWPDGTAITINYGGGDYLGSDPSAADGMLVHRVRPPAACVDEAGDIPSDC